MNLIKQKSLANLAFVIVESKTPQLIYDELLSSYKQINVYI